MQTQLFLAEITIMIALISVLALGWILAATIGTYAYFANDPSQF